MYERVLWFFLGAILFVFAAVIFMSLFLPQADAQTTALQYLNVAGNPLQPLTFIQDSYGNIHVSSSDTYVWRVLRCVAPASGYDEYLSTGVLLQPFDDYDSITWYTEDLGDTDGYASATVINPSLLRGESMGLFVKFTGFPLTNFGPSSDYESAIRVYYLSTAGEVLSDSNMVLSLNLGNNAILRSDLNQRVYDPTKLNPVTGLLYVDLDETLLESRGFLSVHIGKRSSGGVFTNDPNGRFFIYSGLPGTTGFSTFEHHPTTYLVTGIPSTTFPRVEIGDLITGGNLDSGATDIRFVGRNPGTGPDIFRSAINGTVDDVDITYRPLSFVPYTPYYHEGSAGIGRQTFTIPYYELYDDPQSTSTNYQITCTISNPWGTEDLFPHRFTYRVPTAAPPVITAPWFTGNFTHEHNVTTAGGLKLDKQYGPSVVLPVPHVDTPPVVPRVLPIGGVTNQTLNITQAVLPNITRIDPPPIGGFWTTNNFLDLVVKIEDYDGSRQDLTSPLIGSCTVMSKTALTPVYPLQDDTMINAPANSPGSTYGVYHQLYGRLNTTHTDVQFAIPFLEQGRCFTSSGEITGLCQSVSGLVIPPSPDESFTYSCQYDGEIHQGTVLAKSPLYRSLIQDLTHSDIFGWGSPEFLGIGIIGFLGLISCMVGYNRKNLAASAVTFVLAIGLMGYFGILNVTESVMAAIVTVVILAVFQRGAKQ